MTEPTGETTSATPATPDTGEKDWAAEAEKWKALARKHEIDAKAGKSATAKLAEIEEATKTEGQKTAERLAAAEKDAAEARAEALRLRVAAKFGIGDEDADLFLTGADEQTLTKQAERLTARESERKKTGNHVPREGSTSTQPPADELRAFARGVFGGEPT